MEELRFRTGYWADGEARAAFRRFLVEIHGLDLTRWESAGCWDDRYVPFSLFDADGRVVSSVCVYSMPALVAGRWTRLAQISGVGTLPGHRRRGLSTRLTEEALAWARADHEAVFLFADEGAVPFYLHRGFRPVREYVHRVPLPKTDERAALEPIAFDDPDGWARLVEAVRTRAPVSHELFTDVPELTLFHALYGPPGSGRYVPDLDAHVLAHAESERLVVHDVVAMRLPRAAELLPRLAAPGLTEAELRFPIDRLRPDGARRVARLGEHPFVLGPPIWPEPLVFPDTSRA